MRERKKRLEKMAKRATDEQQRKTYLDANFDEESQVMMDMMDSAVSASMVMTEELNTTVETLNKTIKQLKRPASYNEKIAKKSKKMSFGFDEDDFSSSSEEEDEDTLRLKAMGTIVGRKLSDTQRRASNELAESNEEMLRLKAMTSMVERKEEELLRLQAIGSCLDKEKLQVTIENTSASSSSDCEKSSGNEAQQIPEEKAPSDEIIEIKEQEIPDEKPKQKPLPEPLPASEQRPMSEQCGVSAASHVNTQIANPSLENTGSLVLIPPEEKAPRKLAKHCPQNPPAKDVIVIDDDAEGELVDLTKRKDKDKRIFGSEMTYMNPKDTKDERPTSYPPIAMKWVTSIIELKKYGRYHLQHELKRRGVKSGGTVDQQAERLFSIKGLSKKQIPANHRVKAEPVNPPQIPVQLGPLAQIQKDEKVLKAKKLTFEYGKLQEELGNVQFRK